MMEADDAKRDDGTSIAGTLVRLAWHASGTYSKVSRQACFAITGIRNRVGVRYSKSARLAKVQWFSIVEQLEGSEKNACVLTSRTIK